jgi:hypothetical protein
MRGLWRVTARGMAAAGLCATALCMAGAARAEGSLTLSGLFDSDQGRSLDADARWAPLPAWSLGVGVGKGKSGLEGSDLSGTSLRASTDLYLGGFDAGVSMQRWKDSSDLDTRSVRGQAGWTFDSGIGLHALLDDRSLDITYTRQPLVGAARQSKVRFDGTGYGAELSFFGARANAAVHFIDYGYGRSMTRVRGVLAATDTTQFPRLQALVASMATRAAGAPDREIGLSLGREFSRSSLQGQWLLQRDALSGENTNSLSLIHSYRISKHLEMDTTLGLSDGAADGTLAFGGLSFRIR